MDDTESLLVSKLSAIVARKCGIPPASVRQIRIAAALHDVGKARIPASIVGKPSKLDPAEFEIMKMHTILGAEMLSSLRGDLGSLINMVCRYHHEHWDGIGGYWGRRASDLPIAVPIVSICDVFVALTSVRVYKKSPWPPEEALAYIQEKSGTQFSPTLVDVFVPLVRHDADVRALFLCEGGS